MPMIATKVNVQISKKQEKILKEKLGQAISIIPGKSEQWLMLSFEESCRLYFGGDSLEPIAFVQVELLRECPDGAMRQMTEAVTKIIHEELSIAPDHIYIKYAINPAWGWNGGNL